MHDVGDVARRSTDAGSFTFSPPPPPLSALLLAAASFEELMGAFKRVPTLLGPDELMDEAFRQRLKRAELDALEREYRALVARGASTSGRDAGTHKA